MIKFMRSLFGSGGLTGNRKVMGHPINVDLKHIAHIRESNARLTSLHDLYQGYKNTPHAPKLKAVYDKTKHVHAYLVAKKKVHELELFHLQNTDHFINTFSAILHVHQKHNSAPVTALTPPSAPAEERPLILLKESGVEKLKQEAAAASRVELVKRLNRQSMFATSTVEDRAEVPKLSIPAVSINTYSKVFYMDGKDDAEDQEAKEISFTSAKQDKDNFISFVTARLGIDGVSYVGNAMVAMPYSDGSHPAGTVPVVHWNGCNYAFNLTDYRLFPVRINRSSR